MQTPPRRWRPWGLSRSEGYRAANTNARHGLRDPAATPVGKALAPSVLPGKHRAEEVPSYESTRLITGRAPRRRSPCRRCRASTAPGQDQTPKARIRREFRDQNAAECGRRTADTTAPGGGRACCEVSISVTVVADGEHRGHTSVQRERSYSKDSVNYQICHSALLAMRSPRLLPIPRHAVVRAKVLRVLLLKLLLICDS